MKIPLLIVNYFNNLDKQVPVELTLIDNFICDDCYKVKLKSNVNLPARCLAVIFDYEFLTTEEKIVFVINKANVKSLNVEDHTKYLCLADHHVSEENVIQENPLHIGFGVNSKDKSLNFSKKRKVNKVLESQDDILTAFIPLHDNFTHKTVEKKPLPNEEIIEDDFFEFPPWALTYLYYYLKN